MCQVILDIIIGIITTILGVLLALIIDRSRMPKLIIVVTETANTDVTYPIGAPKAGERWKFFRVSVHNRAMPKLLKWLVRQTAENCKASITINGINNNTN